MISKETVDLIFSNARVEEVIGDFVQLKKSGSSYKGLSPFTQERTPSFVVSPAKQIWKDFSSGKGGNVVRFLMEYEHFTYPEALEYLAKKYHIEVKKEGEDLKESIEIKNQKKDLFLMQSQAKDFFIQQLYHTKQGEEIAISYLKERNIEDNIAELFELGYAPNFWDKIVEFLLAKGFSKEQLIDSGLVVLKNDKYFDRFRSRIIFPIHSFSGRILGFAARNLAAHLEGAKYLNSPESEIYHKGKILYGLYQAKQSILKEDAVLLVEGYIDVIALYQAGIKNVVASGGTALTKDQIYLLKRLTSNIILLYDSDQAGIEASQRAIDLLLEEQMDISLVSLPMGEDPDSFIRNYSSKELLSLIKEKKEDFIDFKIKHFKDHQEDPLKKAHFIQTLLKTLAKVSNLIQKEFYVHKIADKLHIREEVLFHQLSIEKEEEKLNKSSYSIKKKEVRLKEDKLDDPLFVNERELIKLLICFGDKSIDLIDFNSQERTRYKRTIKEEIIRVFEMEGLCFSNALHQDIFNEIIKAYKEGKTIDTGFFLKSNDSEIHELLSSCWIDPYPLANWQSKGIEVIQKEERLAQVFTDTLLRYKSNYLLKLIKGFSLELTKKEDKQPEERDNILKKIIRLTELKNAINKELHRFI